MKIADALQGTTQLFLDSAPVIYFVERNPNYISIVDDIFSRIDTSQIIGYTSPVTLAECLINPYKLGLTSLQQDFLDLILNGLNTIFVSIDDSIAQQAVHIRAKYNLRLADALQIAVALVSGCQSVLTNDKDWRRVTEINVLVLDELEL